MLVVTRTSGQKVFCSGPATVFIVKSENRKVKLGFQADKEVQILRGELLIDTEIPQGFTSLRLKRKLHSQIVMDGPFCIEVLKNSMRTVEVSVTADRSVKILRGEILGKEKAESV